MCLECEAEILRLTDLPWKCPGKRTQRDSDEAEILRAWERQARKVVEPIMQRLAAAEAECDRLGRCNEKLSLTHAEQINHQNQRLAAAEARVKEVTADYERYVNDVQTAEGAEVDDE